VRNTARRESSGRHDFAAHPRDRVYEPYGVPINRFATSDRVCGTHRRGGRAPDAGGLVVSALFFFPRGGSAQVARSLARALPAAGWQSTLAAGSLGRPGEPTHAASFFAGIDVHALDYSPALELAEPLAAPVPFQPVLRGSNRRARSHLCRPRRSRLRTARRCVGRAARARRGGRGRPAPSAPPDARERGRGTRLPRAAHAGPAARDRARHAAQDRGRSAAGLALRSGLGPAAASLGAALRPAGRATGKATR
jgi:hypothetical protein